MSKEADAKLATSDSLPAASLPRVLVLSEDIPQTRNAGGIVLWRLFRGYGLEARGERVQAELADQETNRPRDQKSELGDRRRTSSCELPSSASPEAKLFVIGPRPHPDAELLDCPYRELRMPLRRLETSRFSMWKRSLQALGLIPLPCHRTVLRLLGDFRPDAVVTVMQNTPWILTAERTARKLGIPLVLIVHDINEEFEKVFPWAKKALFERNRAVYRAVSRRLCVSPEMAEYLEERYGATGEVMHPNRSEELQPRAAEISLTLRSAADQETKRLRDERSEEDESDFDKGNFDILKDSLPATSNSLHTSAPLTLGYAGSLAYGYGEALVALIPMLREVGARILLSTPRPTGKLKALLDAKNVVEWMPHRADINEMWRMMQKRADVMILPYMNPADSNELLYRTHFPSKLPEYLALGMPVIVSGPEFATGLRYAQGRRKQPAAADQETKGQPEVGGLRPETGDRSLQRPTDQELKRPKDKETEATELGNFERDHFDILKKAPNGAVPCTTREKFVACLLRLKDDGELREELARRAVEAGCRDFDPVRIRESFWQTLQHAAV